MSSMNELNIAIGSFYWREYREEIELHDEHNLLIAQQIMNGMMTRIVIDIHDPDTVCWTYMEVDSDGVIYESQRMDTGDHVVELLRGCDFDDLLKTVRAFIHEEPVTDWMDEIDKRKEQIIERLIDNTNADDATAAYMHCDLHEDDNLNAAIQLMAEAELTEQHLGSVIYSPETSRRLFARLDYARVFAAVQRVLRAQAVKNQRLYLLRSLYNAQTMVVGH